MKSRIIRVATVVSILALVSIPALALPPYCEDVCDWRPPSYHCTDYPPFHVTTCQDWCAQNSCGILLQGGTETVVMPWDPAIALKAALAAVELRESRSSAPVEEP